MLTLSVNERILIVLRRHWWTMVTPSLLTAFLALLPAVWVTFLPATIPFFQEAGKPLLSFLTTIYFMGILLFALIVWMDYYLDVWIVTNERVIDIEQRNLFSRTISEIPMERIQNVSIEVHGVVETILKFGDIMVQTAGQEAPFMIPKVPNLYEAKDLILHYSKERFRGRL